MPEGLSALQRRNYLLLLATIGLYFTSLSFLLLLPKLMKGLGASEAELGWLIGTPLIAFVLLAPYAGYLSDRFSARRLALCGIGLATVSGYALAFVQEVGPYVYFLRLVHGAGHAFTFTPIFSMAAKLLSPEQKARGIAYFTVVVQLGNVLGSLLGSLLVERVSFETFFLLSTAVMCASWVICTRIREEGEGASHAATGSYLALMSQRALWSGMVFILLLGGAFGMVLQFVPTYFDFLHAGGHVGAPIASYWYLTGTLATVALVRVVFSARVYRAGNERLLTLCMLGLPLAVGLLQWVQGPVSALVAAVCFGVTYGLLFPAINALVLVRAGPLGQGAVSGFLAMLYEVGFRGFGFVMGPLAEATSYFTMFGTLALLLGGGLVAFLALEQDRRRWLFAGVEPKPV